jgi:hypothetical protein
MPLTIGGTNQLDHIVQTGVVRRLIRKNDSYRFSGNRQLSQLLGQWKSEKFCGQQRISADRLHGHRQERVCELPGKQRIRPVRDDAGKVPVPIVLYLIGEFQPQAAFTSAGGCVELSA